LLLSLSLLSLVVVVVVVAASSSMEGVSGSWSERTTRVVPLAVKVVLVVAVPPGVVFFLLVEVAPPAPPSLPLHTMLAPCSLLAAPAALAAACLPVVCAGLQRLALLVSVVTVIFFKGVCFFSSLLRRLSWSVLWVCVLWFMLQNKNRSR
jgi:hypothetical protein